VLRLSLFQVADFFRQDANRLSEEANGLGKFADMVRRIFTAGMAGRGGGFLFSVAREQLGQVPGRFVRDCHGITITLS
jgi:hypothetical protein